MNILDYLKSRDPKGPGGVQWPAIGIPPDPKRPRINNPDGSFSTERTITMQTSDGWFNVPTIIDGKQYPENEVQQYFLMGLIPHVGKFKTLEEAVAAAKARTKRIKR
jgi:hypothetical protein